MAIRFRALDERDYAACVAIWNRVHPDRPESVHAWREADREAREQRTLRLRMVAEVSGRIAGFGSILQPWSLIPLRKYRLELTVPREEPARGVEAALYEQLERELRRLRAAAVRTRTRVEREPLGRFFASHGFVERMRSWEMELHVRSLEAEALRPALPPGITLTTLAEERRRGAAPERPLYELDCLAAMDEPRLDPFTPPPFDAFLGWLNAAAAIPEAFFIARAGEEYAGMSVLRRRPESPAVLQQSITAVRREYRRRGIARTLNQAALRYAWESRCETVRAGVASTNTGMLRLNEELGFRQVAGWATLEKPLR